MSPDPHPRYILTLDGLHVLDRWYCHREVYRTRRFLNTLGGWSLPKAAHATALRKLHELNAEHDAWLAAG